MKRKWIIGAMVVAVFLIGASAILVGRDDRYLNVNIQSNYLPGEKMTFRVNARHVDVVGMALYRVDIEEVIDKAGDNGYAGSLSDVELSKAEKVREWKVDLDSGSGSGYSWGEYDMKNPGTGTYILQGESEGIFSTALLMVSEIAAVSKADDDKIMVFVAQKKSGIAVEGAAVKILTGKGAPLEKKTSSDGLAFFPGQNNSQTPIIVRSGSDVAVLNFYRYGYSREDRTFYIFTDRPVYRPGHTVNFKGIIRRKDCNGFSVPEGDKVYVTIRDAKGNDVYKKEFELTEYGSFSGAYELGEEPPLGHYLMFVESGGRLSNSGFLVEEYRKPEFEVEVVSRKDRVVTGESLEFTVEAKYFFGEPLRNAPVKYSVTRRHYYRSWGGGMRYPWYGDWKMGGARYYSYYGGNVVLEGEGETDGDGRLVIKVSETEVDQDMEYVLEARVTEEGRREFSGSGAAVVMSAAYSAHLETSRYLAKPGEDVWISLRTEGIDDLPVSRAMSLKIIKRSYEDGKSRERKVLERTVETDKSGRAGISFVPDDVGYFAVEVSGRDELGNPVSAQTGFHVVSKGRYYYWHSGGGVEIITDREEYSPGDDVNILINTPYQDAHALVTLEGAKIIDARVIRLEGGSGFYSFKAESKHQPTVDLSISIIRDNSLVQERATIIVPPGDKFLHVIVESDKEKYEPGEKAVVRVRTEDAGGRPVDAEVSLGVVDEAIYALNPETAQDIRAVFYGRQDNRVITQSSFWFRARGDEEVMPKAAGIMEEAEGEPMMKSTRRELAEDKSYAAAEIRSDFRDTAYWCAHLTTGPDGVAEVTFSMPDSLTTWRLTSRAVTKDTRVGETVYKVVARKNLMVRLQTPRFFTQNDEQNVTAVVNNYLDTDKQVKAVLNVKGLRLREKNEKLVNVPAGEAIRVEWRAVVEEPQDAWITVKALTDEESDAMQLTIPVLPHGAPGRDAAAGEAAEAGARFDLVLPEDYLPGTEKFTITLTPSLTAGMFDVLEYLAGYPYGCVEQTMSRFLPDVVIAEALQRAGRPMEGKLEELPEMVADGVKRLRDMQHGDGGWGWWKDDDTHPYMTAYVVFGLSRARRADFSLPAGMLDGGVDALKVMLSKKLDADGGSREREDFTWDARAYMLFALSEAGEEAGDAADTVYRHREELSDYGRAVLAMALNRFGNKEMALALVRDLEKNADINKLSARWEGETFHYRWTDNVVETTAFALMAFIEVDPGNPVVQKAVRYINISRRGDRWYSTKDTAAALMALTRYMSEYEDPDPDYEFTIELNGTRIGSGNVTRQDVSGTGIRYEISKGLKKGKNIVTVGREGKGNLYYYGAVEYFEGADFLDALDSGIRVERYYSRDMEGKQKLEQGAEVRPGGIIWSHVRVVPRSAYDYVMVEDFLPSGFEVHQAIVHPGGPVRPMIAPPYYYAHREFRDEKAVAFYTSILQDGKYEMATPLRAEVPGEVSAMPCRASLMYFPDVGGRSEEFRLEVLPE